LRGAMGAKSPSAKRRANHLCGLQSPT
jgi:hypothetical protein